MTVSQYLTKVKSLCDEIQNIDAACAINEAKMRWIIIRDLNPKCSSLVTATKGWAIQSSLAEFESMKVSWPTKKI